MSPEVRGARGAQAGPETAATAQAAAVAGGDAPGPGPGSGPEPERTVPQIGRAHV